MSTKNISITEDAYNRLVRLRKEDESFSKVITRITRGNRLLELRGILSKQSTDLLEKGILESRKINRKLHEERHKKLIKEFE